MDCTINPSIRSYRTSTAPYDIVEHGYSGGMLVHRYNGRTQTTYELTQFIVSLHVPRGVQDGWMDGWILQSTAPDRVHETMN